MWHLFWEKYSDYCINWMFGFTVLQLIPNTSPNSFDLRCYHHWDGLTFILTKNILINHLDRYRLHYMPFYMKCCHHQNQQDYLMSANNCICTTHRSKPMWILNEGFTPTLRPNYLKGRVHYFQFRKSSTTLRRFSYTLNPMRLFLELSRWCP